MKVAGLVLLFVGLAAAALAQPPVAPEISVGSAGSALALLSGVLLIVRARRKQ